MKLQGTKIAFLLADYYEDLEFWYPLIRMKEEGAQVSVVALIIPGGYSPDHMRRSPKMIALVEKMNAQEKVIAAICHAGWMLISAGIVRDRRVTGFFSIKDDLVNAGGLWEDKEVVVDGRLITSRNPDDLTAFCRSIINSLA